MKPAKSTHISVIAIVLLSSVLFLTSCQNEKQEKTGKLSPDIYPAANVEYEYNSEGLPASATVFEGEKVYCKYEYVYANDGVLEKRIEKNAEDSLICDYEYENGKTLKYKTVYSDDGVIEKKFTYGSDGLTVQRTNYNDDGNEELKIDYAEDGKVFLTTEHKYYDDGTLSEVTKTGEQGVAQRLYYNGDGVLIEKYEYTYGSYTDSTNIKHTEYDDKGNVEIIYESTYFGELKNYETAYREDGRRVFYCSYSENGVGRSYIVRYVEHDELGLPSSLKCYGEHGMVHNVIYDSGKTVSWSEYKYDENGKLTEKIEHPVEGKSIYPLGSGTEIDIFNAAETEYGYINGEEWEYPDNLSAHKYFLSSDITFEEGDTVSVDELIDYFTIFKMRDENNSYELYEHLEQYRTGRDENLLYEISIPKELVNAEIEKHFSVKVDGSESEYTDPENEDCYLLRPDGRGMMSVAMKNHTVDGNKSTAIYAFYHDIGGSIYRKAEICIENEDSEEDFKIIYVREIE
ncbi:MAG: hypothetical protein E7647_00380 [Ruminococcaceae bacterium]|nr:hypothetical protein [Oscillospiraceae bacterium]